MYLLPSWENVHSMSNIVWFRMAALETFYWICTIRHMPLDPKMAIVDSFEKLSMLKLNNSIMKGKVTS